MLSKTQLLSKNVYTSEGQLNFTPPNRIVNATLKDEFDIESILNGYNIDNSLFKKKYNTENGLIHMNFSSNSI